MKKLITAAMLLGACLFVSCQKGLNLKPTTAGGLSSGGARTLAGGGGSTSTGGGGSTSTGGGGTSTGGGKSGGTTVTPPTSTVPVADTVPSSLPIGTIISTGTWKVTSYLEGGKDATSDFSNYTFNFNINGTITAHQGGNSFSGTWVYVDNVIFYYGVPIYGSSPFGFNIYMGTSKPLNALGKNLFISKKTTTMFHVDSVNPAENAHIIFTKIAN